MRKFGALRDVHDIRDRMFKLSRSSPQDYPLVVDLRESAGPMKDQHNLGSCTGHTFSSTREWIARKYEKSSPVLSPLFLYVQELLAVNEFPNDNGAMPRTGCQVLKTVGCCEDALYPDAMQKLLAPTPAQLANALKWRTGAYHRLATLLDVISCLADKIPWPVTVGFSVYDSFQSEQVADTGIMPIPRPSEKLLGGHEVLCLGYDQNKQMALMQNSWSDAWGQKGYFWMPFKVLLAPSTDLWMVHTGAPWKAA